MPIVFGGTSEAPKYGDDALRSRIADLEAALNAIVARDNVELGLCDMDGGAPGECAPYPSDELKLALSVARTLVAMSK